MQNESTTLSYLPVGIFGSVMGLTGLSGAWKLAHQYFGVPLWVSQAIGLAAAVFVALAVAYGVKAVSGWDTVRAEFSHPIAANLFGTPMISLLLLPFVLVDYSLTLARLAWVLGAVGMTALAWVIVMRWMTVRLAAPHVSPPWIVPVVGMLDVPLQPSLLILVAPFSVGFTAYVTTTGNIDLFAQVLYMLTLFVLAVLLGRLRHLPHCSPFRVSWWAASFPLAASAGATIRYAGYANSMLTDGIALLVLAIASVTIALFLLQTLAGVFKGQLKALA